MAPHNNPVTAPLEPAPENAPLAPEGLPVTSLPPPGPRMSWGKRIGAAVFLVAVASITVASLLPKPVPPIVIQAAVARKGPITRLVSAAGKLQAATEVKLSSNLSGDLLDLSVQEGDAVRKGQVLGRIDARRFGAQLNQQRALLGGAQAELDGVRVNVAQLAADLARVEKLAQTGNASSAEVEQSRAKLDAERAHEASARQKIAQASAALNEADHNLSLTTLRAPIDGIVTKREKQVGERVRGSDFSEDVILVISTLSKMEVKLEVGEHEVVYVKDGDPAEVEIDAIPERKFKAQVVEVARNATVKNPGTEQEVTSFIVRLALTEQVAGALPGMSAQATISTDTREQAVVVPIQAVTVRSERDLPGAAPTGAGADPAGQPPAPGQKPKKEALKKVVFVVENGAAKIRPVETGLASDREIEIVSGLKEGEKVVEGPYRVLSRELADGKKVSDEQPGGPKPRKG